MPPTMTSRSADIGGGLRGLVLPVTIIGAILVFVVPIPPALLDVLLSANLTIAVVVLLTTLSIRTPHEFSAFPTILLTTTLTRLVLNVATTRLVLTRGGEAGLEAAGGVIRAFGEFVAGDQVLVGVILFSILVVIQFVVITRGATRIGEVAARFMLDGLPGRQMAIDADVHAGLIDQHEAHRRREEVYRQADFFGAMDGAGKFVRGDAVAGVVILLVNIAGGLFLGADPRHGAGRRDQRLHQADDRRRAGEPGPGVPDLAGVGDHRNPVLDLDGPEPRRTRSALLAARRAGRGGRVPGADGDDAAAQAAPADAGRRAGRRRRVPRHANGRGVRGSPAGRPGAAAGAGVPAGPGAWRAARGPTSRGRPGLRRRVRDMGCPPPAANADPAESGSDRMEDLLHVDPLELEIGFRLIGLADPSRGGDLLDRLKSVRQRVARELGLIVPQVRIHDSIVPAAQRVPGEDPRDAGRAGDRLCRSAAGRAARRPGHATRRPRRCGPAHRPAGGLDPLRRPRGGRARRLPRPRRGQRVVAGHFGEIVADHADELLTREQVERLLERVRSAAPTLVGEVVPGLLRAGELQRILQNLLRERVSIRDLETILETLASHAGRTKDIEQLTEQVRRSLARQIAETYRGADDRLRVVTLARELDDRLAAAGSQAEARPAEALGDETARSIIHAAAAAVGTLIDGGYPPGDPHVARQPAPCSRTSPGPTCPGWSSSAAARSPATPRSRSSAASSRKRPRP